jgi:hypothetical protein
MNSKLIKMIAEGEHQRQDFKYCQRLTEDRPIDGCVCKYRWRSFTVRDQG